jgi:predicted metal-dependent hydrolase
MITKVKLGETTVDVVQKDIKNVHLSVYPPNGRVKISAPLRMSAATIRVFAISKIGWIRQQQAKLRGQERESPREYLDCESHYVWGKRYLLKVLEDDVTPSVKVEPGALRLCVRPGASEATREAVIASWYRQLLKAEIPPLIEAWEPRLNVAIRGFYVRRMKTKWGSCNPAARTIRLNTELAKKPAQCLEYIVVHELVHLIERHHNDRFASIMDKHLPQWRLHRQELNAAPLAHETWGY